MLEKIGDRIVIEFGTKALKPDYEKADASHEGLEKKLSYDISHVHLDVQKPLFSEIEWIARDVDDFCDALEIANNAATGYESFYKEGEFKHFCNGNHDFKDIVKFFNLLTFAMDKAPFGKLRLVFEKVSEKEFDVYFEMPFSKKAYSSISAYHNILSEKAIGQKVGGRKQLLWELTATVLLPHLSSLTKSAQAEEFSAVEKLYAKPLQEAISDVVKYSNRFNAFSALTAEQLKEVRSKLEEMSIHTTSMNNGEELSLRPAIPTRGKSNPPIYVSDDCNMASVPTAEVIYLQTYLQLGTYQAEPIISII